VHVGAAAALFQLGELQAALPVFRSVLEMDDSDPRGIPSNASQVVGTPIDAYASRPRALDTIYQFFRAATVSGSPELRAGAALRLVGIDSELAFRVASAVLALKQPKREDDIYRYHISVARRAAVNVLKAIGDTRAKMLLKTLAQDRDKSVRVAAECALRDIEQKE
jgi:HEAT repeat protein